MSESARPEEAPHFDPFPLVLGSLAFGILVGVALLALVVWGVRTLQGTDLSIARTEKGFTPALLPLVVVGTFSGMIVAGAATWTLLGPIGNPWRKAMLAIISGAAAFVVALVTKPIDELAGRQGLLAAAAIAVLLSVLVGRRVSALRTRA